MKRQRDGPQETATDRLRCMSTILFNKKRLLPVGKGQIAHAVKLAGGLASQKTYPICIAEIQSLRTGRTVPRIVAAGPGSPITRSGIFGFFIARSRLSRTPPGTSTATTSVEFTCPSIR